MINIIVDGVRLDLLPANLSYKRTNNAYSFGKLTLNRTQSFKLPKTQKNMQLFGCGLPYAFGEGERRYFDAQLQGSGFVENGLIYVDSIDAEEITCIFIFGNLIKLKEIASVKNMAEVLGEYDSAISAPAYANTKLANATDLQLYDAVQYRNQYSTSYGYYNYIMPSVSVRGLLNCANEIYGEIFDLSPLPNYRLILSTTKSASREPVVFAKTSLNEASPAEDLKKLFVHSEGTANIYSYTGNVGEYQAKYMIEYVTLRDSEIKMPADLPEDVFIIQDNSRYDSTSGKVNVDLEFFGGYSFETDLRTVNSLAEEGTRATIGEPLAGRTITIPRGKSFTFYSKANFHNTQGAGGSSQNNYRGFFSGDLSPFEFIMPVVSLKEEGELAMGNSFLTYMIDNLPKMSFVDLYNSVAILAGGYMTYANNKITIGVYGGEVYTLKNVISHGKLKREGLTSAQNNYVQFEESEAVKPANRIIKNYPTVNALLDEEAIVYKFPYSEGEEYTDNNDLQSSNVVISKVAEEGTGYKPIELLSDAPIIAIAGDGQYLKRVTLTTNSKLEQIQQNSTQIEVTCYMTLFEFMGIKEHITIEYLHKQWAWISATWQKNKAKFALQLI
jgi:hypothetical protein